MKIFTTSLLVALMSTGAFAKGGDNDYIGFGSLQKKIHAEGKKDSVKVEAEKKVKTVPVVLVKK
ncbi:MAG: hypothetical protein AB7T49_21470 [Oligoflexales bacterium]